MNFLKRAGAILMVVAIFASSCNKYADDFEQINTKLDALAMSVAGVAQLTTDMAALKSQVTALQTAVAALPTATAQTAQFAAVKVETDKILAQIATITTTLNAVAVTGTATKTAVDGLVTSMAALKTQITTDNAAMMAKLTTLTENDVAQTAKLNELIAANTNLLTKITKIETDLAAVALTGTAADETTALTIGGLQAMLDAQKIMLEQIMANTAMYNGDVNVTTDAEVVFYMAKIAQLGIVNGSVNINYSGISASKLVDARTITSKIQDVIGSANSVTVKFKQGHAVDLSALYSVAGNMKVEGSDKGAGVDVTLPMLNNIGGTLTLDYDGPYVHATLSKVGGDLFLVNKAVVALTTPLGTTSINLPTVAVKGKVDDVVGVASGVVVYPLATEVVLAGGVSSLTADKATNIKLGSATYAAGLGVSSSLTAAATIDLSAATAITGAATVTGFGATAVNLSKLVTATGGLMVTTGATGTVDLTAYNEPAGLVVTGPKTLVLPAMVAGAIVSTTAETVTLAVHDWVSVPTIGAVKWLTAGAVTKPVTIPATALTANISGKVTTAVPMVTTASVTSTVANTVLTDVTLGGTLALVNLGSSAALVNVTTSGVINSFTLDNCDKVVGMTLAHAHYEGGTGSVVVVQNNLKLASLTTSTDEMTTLTVVNNAALASANFSSYVTKTVGGNPTITINTNLLSGAYTNAVLATITTPYIECTITSAAITTLKAYVALYSAPVLSIDLDAVKIGTGTATTLSVKMANDADAQAQWVLPVLPALPGSLGGNDAVAGISNKVELAHVL